MSFLPNAFFIRKSSQNVLYLDSSVVAQSWKTALNATRNESNAHSMEICLWDSMQRCQVFPEVPEGKFSATSSISGSLNTRSARRSVFFSGANSSWTILDTITKPFLEKQKSSTSSTILDNCWCTCSVKISISGNRSSRFESFIKSSIICIACLVGTSKPVLSSLTLLLS